MYNNVSNVWRLEDFHESGFSLYENKKLFNLLVHYLGNEWVNKGYKKGVNIGLADPHCKNSLYIEVGNWYRNNWYRNKNGNHIAFYFWNHGGLTSFEREGGKIVKNISRPEDKKRKNDDRFIVFVRDAKEIEEGVLYDRGFETGSRLGHLIPIINEKNIRVGRRIEFRVKDSPYPELYQELKELLQEKGVDTIAEENRTGMIKVMNYNDYHSMLKGPREGHFISKFYIPITRTEIKDGRTIVYI